MCCACEWEYPLCKLKCNNLSYVFVDELLAKLARSQELMEKINAAIAPKMPEVIYFVQLFLSIY